MPETSAQTDILQRRDADGTSVGEALDAIGYRGTEPVGQLKLGSFVELHIEQGPILEAEHKTIGVVDHGQGIIWYNGTITGFASHAGATPMRAAPRRAGRRCPRSCSRSRNSLWRTVLTRSAPSAKTVIANPSRNVIAGET